jgi:aminopeptidase
MMMEELLNQYARLVVRVGVNLQPRQLLVINAPVECADFARRLAREAYEAGGHDVTIVWNDEQFSHLRYQLAKQAVFTEFPAWRQSLYMDNAEQGAAFISILAEDPEIFRDVDPERLTLAQQAAGAALLEYRARMMSNKNAWCVVSIPTAAWASKVFPGLSAEEAVQQLWQKIFSAVRVQADGDAVAAWRQHTAFLQRAAAFMNRWQFQSLHYVNSLGTDLTVHLPSGHIWAGGSEDTQGGTPFVANMPTEEIYTLPQRDGVDGIVAASKPLNYNGNLIENFRLTFKAGKVVSYEAEKGGDILKELLAMDEGACRLGEVALVPFDSPISKSGVLFYNTLFDENASCHLALGKAYPTCLTGGAVMTTAELLAHGVNDSLIHEDFMVGTRDLSITGCTADGRKVPVFRDGNFVSLA